jgi:hypothetical protein
MTHMTEKRTMIRHWKQVRHIQYLTLAVFKGFFGVRINFAVIINILIYLEVRF